jgi:hypothetical protein
MNTKLLSLLKLYDSHQYNKIRDTWAAFGSLYADDKIKVYIADSIFRVQPSLGGGCAGALIYVVSTYQVGEHFNPIDWSLLSVDAAEKFVSTEMGIVYPHFKILLTPEEFNSITEPVDPEYIPYDKEVAGINPINMPDDELELCMVENGVPFIDVSELEYNTKAELCRLFVKPALDELWKWFPITEDIDYGAVGPGTKFEYELPPMCYNALAWVRKNGGNSGGQGAYTSALSFMREQYTLGGGMALGGNSFQGPLRYNKPVPGFTGQGDAMALAMLQRSIAAAQENYVRRVHIRIINKDRVTGKKLATGYSITGGNLELRLCYLSYNWDDIPFEQLTNTRKLVAGYALTGIGLLRQLVKSDIPGALDGSALSNLGKSYKDEVIKEWKSLPSNYAIGIRGSS